VVRADDDRGSWVEYRYAGNLLTDVVRSDGRARQYAYADDQLTEVRDEKGRRLVRTWYEGTWVVRQEYGNGQRYEMRYDLGPNSYYAERATVVLPDGSTRSFETGPTVLQFIKDIRR
jgi:hypothetical protein